MISVIIPMYNSGKSIKNLIGNLLMQTYCNLEILLIDDGSTDNTSRICKEIIKRDKRFRYFYQENAGAAAARNFGLTQATGEFVAFLDADDRIDDNYLELLMSVCENTDIAVCNVSVEDKTGYVFCKFTLSDRILSSTEALNYLLQRQNINSGPCAKLFRRSIIKKLRFPTLKVYEDILFVMQAFKNADSIGVTDNTEYHYYQNEQSAMHNAIENPPIDIVMATDEIMTFIKKNKTLEDRCVYITLSHLYQYVQLTAKSDKENQKFLIAVQRLFRKYWRQLLFCKSFPLKEKILYIVFILGWMYQKNFIRIR